MTHFERNRNVGSEREEELKEKVPHLIPFHFFTPTIIQFINKRWSDQVMEVMGEREGQRGTRG